MNRFSFLCLDLEGRRRRNRDRPSESELSNAGDFISVKVLSETYVQQYSIDLHNKKRPIQIATKLYVFHKSFIRSKKS